MQITQKIIDQGLLSELAYLKLENYESFKHKKYATLNDLINSGDMSEVGKFISDNPKSTTGIDDSRDQDMLELLKSYTIDKFVTMPSGMQAMVLIKNDGSGITAAFRGTQTGDWRELSKDGKSDGEMALGHEIQQMKDALSFFKNVEAEYDNIAPITITGHSLGGAKAQYVAYKSGTKYETYTYNGFGIKKGEVYGTQPKAA